MSSSQETSRQAGAAGIPGLQAGEDVNNCGFAVSMGIDGPACYEEVAGPNLSKRNPDDGKIHKTPDGKWIKDPRTYRAPDLRRVIFGV